AIEGLERSALIVIGTRDRLHDEAVLARAKERGHVVEVVTDADHGFSVEGSADRSAEVPRTLVRAVNRYLREGPAGGRGRGTAVNNRSPRGSAAASYARPPN